MELMDTSLERLVHGKPGELLPLPTVLHVAADIARGLAYLHPTIVHRDRECFQNPSLMSLNFATRACACLIQLHVAAFTGIALEVM